MTRPTDLVAGPLGDHVPDPARRGSHRADGSSRRSHAAPAIYISGRRPSRPESARRSRPEDTVWGGHRSHGHYLAKGGSLEGLFAEILGSISGCSGGRGGSMHLIDPEQGILGTVPIVAATVPLGCGRGDGLQVRGESRAWRWRFSATARWKKGTCMSP